MNGKEFAEKWNDTWLTHISGNARGIGKITAEVLNDDSVKLTFRLDTDLEPGDGAVAPDKAKKRIWVENTLTLTDVDKFEWTEYRSCEGASKDAAELMKKAGMDYDNDETITYADADAIAAGDGPVVPDVFLPFFAGGLAFDKNEAHPVRLLGYGRTATGRDWKLYPLTVKYAGRKGPLTGLGHCFETELPEEIGRTISVWFDEERNYTGMGDENEVFMAAETEELARTFLSPCT